MTPEKLSLKIIKSALAQYVPQRPILNVVAQEAAVAIVIRSHTDFVEALFIQRAARDGDPWSGDMAFPGGHRDIVDLTMRETAERETFEEVGINLNQSACFLGELDSIEIKPRRSKAILVTPFVYNLFDKDFVLNKNSEVAEILWGSLDEMIIGASHVSKEVKRNGVLQYFPGYTLDNQIIWGLTFRILDQFFSLIRPAERIQ